MKTFQCSTGGTTALILLVSGLLLQNTWGAADKPKSTGSSANVQPTASQKETPEPDYVLEIIEGVLKLKAGRQEAPLLGNVVNVLRELYPTANIVVAPSIANMQISDLKLRATELPQALEAIRVAAEGKIMWRFGLGGGAVDPATGLPVPAAEGSLYAIEPVEEPLPPLPARDIEVFNVGGYLRFLEQAHERDDKAVDDSMSEVIRLIRSCYDELHRGAPPAEAPSFQFHRGANLLIVIGPRDLLDVARRVINALPGQPPMAPGQLLLPQPGGTPAPPGAPSSRR